MKKTIINIVITSGLVLFMWLGLVIGLENSYDFYRVAGVLSTIVLDEHPVLSGIIISSYIGILSAVINNFINRFI